MLTWAIGKAIHNIEEHRTKEMKYLDGIPKAEFLQRLPTMTTVNKEQIMMKLDGIQTGTTTVEAAMYDDDEDSDTDGEDCATPPEPEENEDCEVHARD